MRNQATSKDIELILHPIGYIESPIIKIEDAPSQGNEGAPNVWIAVNESVIDGLFGMKVGQNIIVLTWLHQAKRDVLKLHPRGNKNNPIIVEIEKTRIKVAAMEAINGTPVIDIKPII